MVVDFYKAMKAVTDIKKGLEDGRSLLKGHEGRRGHFKPFFLTRNAVHRYNT